MSDQQKPVFTTVHEQKRTYHYSDGTTDTIDGVVSINVSKSGTHRINTVDGKKHIVPPGWRRISFEAADWTF